MGGDGVGFHVDDLVTPASVVKIQVALAVEKAIAAGFVEGSARRLMLAANRTPGPVGVSLMRDDVSMSVRDLVVAMLTISDNAATDELINVIGLDATEPHDASARHGPDTHRERPTNHAGRDGPRGPLFRLRRSGRP
jgi:beta-lactamase class A